MKALEEGQSIKHTQGIFSRKALSMAEIGKIHFVISSVELRNVQIIVNLTSCDIYRKENIRKMWRRHICFGPLKIEVLK